ncbi:hypothetical protein HAZT_HAZT009512, partial [Hyalella azteca]
MRPWVQSSLLHCMLGELSVLQGSVEVSGTIAYASQEPWLSPGSIRENIIFGKKYHQKKYSEVIKVCGLEADLQQLPQGDLTLLGDRGTTLSGGQKARINLARYSLGPLDNAKFWTPLRRFLYLDGNVVLLDDPLNAVDAAVGKQLFDLCIRGYLRRQAVILVTHHLQYMSAADNILVLQE